jgi:hypothetical protein
MIDFDNLYAELNDISSLVKITIDEDFDFNVKDEAFVIESGSLLAHGDLDSKTGIRGTQTYGVGDPIGFAEAIACKEKAFQFRKLSNVTLRKFKAVDIRREVNASNVLSRTIIRYSIARIFGQKKSAGNFYFEENFIDVNQKALTRLDIRQGQAIFTVNTKPRAIFFIEKGSVEVVSSKQKQLTVLRAGECFGESALINDIPHRHSAVANTDVSLLLIQRARVLKELDSDQPLVRFTVVALLKRLALMNKLRGVI